MWWIACAMATEVGVSLGLAHTANDPFVNTAALTLDAEIRPVDWLGFALAGAVMPVMRDGGEADWTPFAHTIVDAGLAPDVSRMTMEGAFRTVLTPVRGTVGSLSTRVGLLAGVGLVATRDDLTLLRVEGSPTYTATAKEWHPAGLVGFLGEVRYGSWGGRLSVERHSYVERVGSSVDERKNPIWIGVAVTRWLGPRHADVAR